MTKANCLIPGCARPATTRGQCRSHRVTVARAIKSGDTTEAELIRLGFMLPLQPFGRPKGSSVFLATLLVAREAARQPESEGDE